MHFDNVSLPESSMVGIAVILVWMAVVAVLGFLSFVLWRRGTRPLALLTAGWAATLFGLSYLLLGPVSVYVPAFEGEPAGRVQCFAGASAYSAAFARGRPADDMLSASQVECRTRARVYTAGAGVLLAAQLPIIFLLTKKVRRSTPEEGE